MKHIQEVEFWLFRAISMTLEKSTVSDNELSCSRDDGIHHRVLKVTTSPLQVFIFIPRQSVKTAEDVVEDMMRSSHFSIPD